MEQPRERSGIPTGGRYAKRTSSESGVILTSADEWPLVTYEERPWKADNDPGISRRQRLLARGPYQAAVLEPTAHCTPHLDSHTQAVVEQAIVDMVRFDAEMGAGTAPFANLLLRSESAASSQIENLTAGSRKIALAGLGDTSSGNARLIVSNVAAMRAALELSDDLSVHNIREMHRALMQESEPDIAGQVRESQVWIRGNSPHTADFVPPHYERVPEALEDLAEFMQRDDVPALTQSAIAHAQFETIHPFADGNGRTGRAIVGSILRNKGVTTSVTIPVSSGLLTDTTTYFEALTTFREGDIQPIVELFAESTFRAIDNGRKLGADIESTREEYKGRVMHSKSRVARDAVDFLMSEPAITAQMLKDHFGASESAVYRAVDVLVEAEVLKPAGKVKGTAVYIATDIIDALDDFAARAGRRQRH